ncbi:MAG: ferritin family protein [Archaeoglobaceae archaeon]
MNVEQALNKALEMEKSAIDEYEKMKEHADPETADMLDFMINEEKGHVELINGRLKAIKVMRK